MIETSRFSDISFIIYKIIELYQQTINERKIRLSKYKAQNMTAK
jgi:hypothetical protein